MHVRTKSPSPESPEKVSGFAPKAVPILVISTKPLVMIAARALCPIFNPSEIPVVIAIIFFYAPPISTTMGSSLVKTFSDGFEKIDRIR